MGPTTSNLLAMDDNMISRRSFIRAGAVSTAAILLPGPVMAAARSLSPTERSLAFYNTHTGERFKSVYWAWGEYIPESLTGIDRILCDHRTGEVKPIDRRLLDLLFALKRKLGSENEFHVISGYRSPASNTLLNKNSSGVAKKSFHLQGKAIDISLPGSDLSKLRTAALSLQAGGVGYYPDSNFVHLDVGPFRQWSLDKKTPSAPPRAPKTEQLG